MPQPYFFMIERTLVECYTFYQIIFFVQKKRSEKMAINPYGHYSYADTIYTLNVTPV